MKLLVKFGIVTLLGAVVSMCVSCGSTTASSPSPSPAPVPAPNAAGVAVVSGKLVMAGTNTIFLPRGFDTNGVLYPTQYAATLCTQSQVTPGSMNAQWLAEAQAALTAPPLPGLGYNASFQAMVQDWHANSVRIHVSPGALEYEEQNGLSAYTNMARGAIAQARAAGLMVFISMQAELYGCTPYENGVMQKLPDEHTELAWKQLLNATITKDTGILLDVFNEPDTSTACNTGIPFPGVNWIDWATGCGTDPRQGMLTVGLYLRGLAPNNVLVFDADASAASFAGFVVPGGMPSNSAYTVHPFQYAIQGSESASVSMWNDRFGSFEQSGNAVIVTAWNEDFSCPTDPGQTITNDFLQSYLPGNSIGMVAYDWDAPYWGTGYLVNSYNYPGNTANYSVVDPDNSGCAQNGGNELLKEFQLQAGL